MAYRLFFIILLCALLLSSCQSAATPQAAAGGAAATLPAPTVQPGAGEQSGYPVEQTNPQVEEAYPGIATEDPANRVMKTGELPNAPKDAPKPQSGKASISGVLFSFTSNATIPDTLFYLTPAVGKKAPPLFIGPNEKNGDIVSRSDGKGNFSLDNIPPGDYFLIVWAPYSWSPAVKTQEKDYPAQLLELKEGQQLPMGVVNFSWP